MKVINENSIINGGLTFSELCNLRREVVNSEVTTPISFKDLFGDLSNYVFEGDLNIFYLGLNSLKGCPCEVRGSFDCSRNQIKTLKGCPQVLTGSAFKIEENPNLKNLKHFPKNIAVYAKLHIGYSLASSLKNLNIDYYKNLKIVLFGFASTQGTTNPIKETAKYIVKNFIEFRETNGSFEKIRIQMFDYLFGFPEFEKIYLIYKKVDYNEEKLDRALALL